MRTKIFTVNLYDFLNEDKESAKICKRYQEHNRLLIERNPDLGFEYEQVDISPDMEDSIKELTGLYDLSPKHKYQMISDLVRYSFLRFHPGSVFIDTDFVIFGRDGLRKLRDLVRESRESGLDYTAGEMGCHGQHSCNWLMICTNKCGLADKLSALLMENASKRSISNWKNFNPMKDGESDVDYERRMVFDLFWGYKLYEYINPNTYRQIPYYNWQCSYWDGDWKDKNVIDTDNILGCHFFGFAKGRPTITEFLEYHGIDEYKELF